MNSNDLIIQATQDNLSMENKIKENLKELLRRRGDCMEPSNIMCTECALTKQNKRTGESRCKPVCIPKSKKEQVAFVQCTLEQLRYNYALKEWFRRGYSKAELFEVLI